MRIKNTRTKTIRKKGIRTIALTMLLALSLMGCTTAREDAADAATEITDTEAVINETSAVETDTETEDSAASIISSVEGSILDTTGLFSERDLEQSADLTGAVSIELKSGEDVTIDAEGVYVLSGDVENATVIVDAGDEAKVQIVLDGISITNETAPAIYAKSADKVFVTTTGSENYMEVSGSYEADGDTNLDAVIFSKADLVLNGTGTLEVVSDEGNGIASKDELKITGGKYVITASADGIEANDAICIYDGDITIVTGKDALHSENEDDASLGYIYILNGTFNIKADDDAIRGTSIVQIDGGTINIETCTEGIEGTYIQINGGETAIYAADDGINATTKSTAYDVAIEVNGGTISVSMASGDTDAFDSNGTISINGGTIDIEANSAFDSNGTAELNGGDVTVNGQAITQITQSQMGGGKRGR
ncbi:carbohydrate-binding domain-containing protein [Anaerobium acetethylicum]|uniref:Carbohydrate-binding domain-containing protein n=1 Tax=Anaerobium acetethylicum TaxID=1619234 RepID=A0A1D3TWX4_9FIRM|nr:carbohydrate-binding domain-containing protein [Anaerobium acetethylicum]SCP98742.1 protein of unknown function [Anaerobium acetethylicum]